MKCSHAFLPLQNARAQGSSREAENELHIFTEATTKIKDGGCGGCIWKEKKKKKAKGCRKEADRCPGGSSNKEALHRSLRWVLTKSSYQKADALTLGTHTTARLLLTHSFPLQSPHLFQANVLPWRQAGSKSDAEMKKKHFAASGFTG